MRLAARLLCLGALPPNPQDLVLLAARMDVFACGFKGTGSARPLAFPAAEPVLGSHPCVALSHPVQVGSVSTTPIRSSTKKQRPAITPLTGCLTFGVHFTATRGPLSLIPVKRLGSWGICQGRSFLPA